MYKIINLYNNINSCILYILTLKKLIYIIISRIYPLNPMSHLSGIVISSSPQPNPSINYIHFLLEKKSGGGLRLGLVVGTRFRV